MPPLEQRKALVAMLHVTCGTNMAPLGISYSPQGQSLRTTNSCGGSISAIRANSLTTKPVVAEVA